jgi:Sulfotransferase family
MLKLFLVGAPRSGTTLLQTILASQAKLFTLKETHFFRHLQRRRFIRLVDRVAVDQDRVKFAFAFVTDNNKLEGSYDFSEIQSLASAARAFDRLMTEEAGHHGLDGWLEKTPEHMFFMPAIRRYVPGAKFVHILRDGQDVVASMLDAQQKYPESWSWLGSVDEMVKIYNRYVRTTRSNRGRADTFVVRYNDLVERNGPMLDSLARFIGRAPGDLSFDNVASYRSDIVRPDEAWKIRSEKHIVDTRNEKFGKLPAAEQKRVLSRLATTEDIVSG